jgi:site-specific DNA-methyltransferase (adenine-specific)
MPKEGRVSETLGPFELGRVHQVDCLEAIKLLPPNCIPMIWTDPPYGHNNNNGDLIHAWEKALGVESNIPAAEARPILNDSAGDAHFVFTGMLREAPRVLTQDCCCCCCCGGGGPDPQFARWSLLMDEKPWRFFHAVVWDKEGLGMGWRYRRNYELVLVSHLRAGKLKWEYEGSGVETANVVRLGKIIPSAEQHPTQKPVELVEHFLRLHTKPGDIVLDPFSGSGTTGVACARLGRRFLGFELDPHWCEVANRRIGAIPAWEDTPLFGPIGTALAAQTEPGSGKTPLLHSEFSATEFCE